MLPSFFIAAVVLLVPPCPVIDYAEVECCYTECVTLHQCYIVAGEARNWGISVLIDGECFFVYSPIIYHEVPQGPDPEIFADGFESGDYSGWSKSLGYTGELFSDGFETGDLTGWNNAK